MSSLMRCVHFARHGGPEVLELGERQRPAPKPGEVLVAVAFAGLNGNDLTQRQGGGPVNVPLPYVPGLEVSGVVAALGDDVTGLAVGDRVCALLPLGGYAEFCAVDHRHVLKLPDEIGLGAGAGIIEAAATVWTNVFEAAGLKSGEALLVHGGTSGIGTTAIQLAVAAGARVFATAGSDEKAAACERLGAMRAINYRTEAFASVIADETAGGVDVILDIIGASYFADNLASLAIGGRLAMIALRTGRQSDIDLSRIMMRRLVVTGSTLRSRPAEDKGRIVASVRDNIWPLLVSGAYRPVIDKVFPLTDAAGAHAYMASSRHIGKILLAVN
ncbi:MAG TPA: NAD(P)H-quinone oxidoreductase [Devosiaceae bacterium]|jgi:NADPH2:quinone reductase